MMQLAESNGRADKGAKSRNLAPLLPHLTDPLCPHETPMISNTLRAKRA